MYQCKSGYSLYEAFKSFVTDSRRTKFVEIINIADCVCYALGSRTKSIAHINFFFRVMVQCGTVKEGETVRERQEKERSKEKKNF